MAKILLIGRSISFFSLLSSILTKQGHTVMLSFSHSEALGLYFKTLKNPYDIVISDHNIPKYNEGSIYNLSTGFELFSDIKKKRYYDMNAKTFKEWPKLKQKETFTLFILLVPYYYDCKGSSENNTVIIEKNNDLFRILSERLRQGEEELKRMHYKSLVKMFFFPLISFLVLFYNILKKFDGIGVFFLSLLGIIIMIKYYLDNIYSLYEKTQNREQKIQ